jgi:hypothetical protein
VRSGYACFTIGGEPLEWPSGYSAIESSHGDVQILDAQGKIVLRTGQPAQFNETELTAGANACTKGTATVMGILNVTAQ